MTAFFTSAVSDVTLKADVSPFSTIKNFTPIFSYQGIAMSVPSIGDYYLKSGEYYQQSMERRVELAKY